MDIVERLRGEYQDPAWRIEAAAEIERLRAALERGHYLAQAARRAVERREQADWLDLNAAAHEFQAAYDAARNVEQSLEESK